MNEPNIQPVPPPPAAYPVSAAPPPPPVQPAQPAAPPAAFATPLAFRKSPGLAGVLSMFPGVGHIYLGLYQRAVVFFAIWVLTLAIASTGRAGPLGVLIPFWWFFVLIDAVRQAKAINATGAAESNIVAKEMAMKAGGNLAFGILMILFGAFFLLDRLVTIDLSFLIDWWPLLLVAFGAWQVFAYYKAKQAAEAQAAGEANRELNP
jgi:hypothetical protein